MLLITTNPSSFIIVSSSGVPTVGKSALIVNLPFCSFPSSNEIFQSYVSAANVSIVNFIPYVPSPLSTIAFESVNDEPVNVTVAIFPSASLFVVTVNIEVPVESPKLVLVFCTLTSLIVGAANHLLTINSGEVAVTPDNAALFIALIVIVYFPGAKVGIV
jgi:hypothetical protein